MAKKEDTQVETQQTEAPKTESAKVAAPALKFKVSQVLTIPLLKPSIDVPFYVKLTGKIFTGKKIESGEHAKMEAAELVNVVNLETAEEMQLIVPAVLQSILDEHYKNGEYVGKCFQMVKHAKPSGKSYHPFSCREIELEA